jgi:hypothetical protein
LIALFCASLLTEYLNGIQAAQGEAERATTKEGEGERKSFGAGFFVLRFSFFFFGP